MSYIRQGDVLFIPINTIPNASFKKKVLVVAEGEFTGHHHQFMENQASIVTLYQMDEQLFSDISQDAVLIHDEHDSIKIPSGKYEIKIQRELDLLGQIQKVMD